MAFTCCVTTPAPGPVLTETHLIGERQWCQEGHTGLEADGPGSTFYDLGQSSGVCKPQIPEDRGASPQVAGKVNENV